MVPHEESMEALWSVVAVISLAVVVLGALGVVSCLVGHQRPVPGGMGGEPPHSTLPMLALHSGMERLRLEAGVGAGRPERQSSHAHAQAHAHARRAVDCAVDRAVRLAAVSTDLQLDLPPSIALPDGEEYPPGASARLHIRDPEQESEIYQKCVRPPPNKTVYDGESPPPYRPSSAGSGNLPRYPLGYPHHPPPHPHGQPHGHPHGGYAHGHPHGHGPVGPPAPAAGG
ncbi:protein TMEPAI-like [Frankliniella occidentalis]|uniref:Protein TMEPAI-like n=1 Tax=Frankliniella occidentalis TaxID=133901 RepID=A0A9C6X5M7_FRAOC|nr:protein TMEPAI-like [Frankliniella occidentalis]